MNEGWPVKPGVERWPAEKDERLCVKGWLRTLRTQNTSGSWPARLCKKNSMNEISDMKWTQKYVNWKLIEKKDNSATWYFEKNLPNWWQKL